MATGLAAELTGGRRSILASGAINALGTVETYLVGSSTPVATYTDYDLVTPNATTVTLDAGGYPASGGIYLDSTIAYKFIEKDVNGATVKTYNLAALFNGPFSIAGNVTISGTLGVTGATTLSNTLAVAGNIAVNTNKFTVTASSGTTLIAGALGVGSAATTEKVQIRYSATAVNAISLSNSDSSGRKWVISDNAGSIGANGKLAIVDATSGNLTRLQIDSAGLITVPQTLNVVTAYQFNGTAGLATFGPSAVTALTVKGGLVTAAT